MRSMRYKKWIVIPGRLGSSPTTGINSVYYIIFLIMKHFNEEG